jgi:phosphate transport system protein
VGNSVEEGKSKSLSFASCPFMTHLETELKDIKRELLLGMNRARNAVVLSGQALLEQSTKKAERSRSMALEIEHFRVVLEDKCLMAFSKHQLMASDARFVAFVLSSLTDLERSGDYAAHIAEDAVQARANLEILHLLFEKLAQMLERLSLALERTDAALALEVAAEDAIVDRLIDSATKQVISSFHDVPLEQGLASLRVLRSAQRIGDHLENIAERLSFAIAGQR